MPELKHGFGAAKMNKDADERIVPNGEYRDALNVEIVTSESSDTGSMQTLLGNTEITNSPILPLISNKAKCVGSIADEKNNYLYYFVADPENYTDYILRYSVSSGEIIPIIVDKYIVNANTIQGTSSSTTNVKTHIVIDALNSTENITNIRPGMTLQGTITKHINVAGISFPVPTFIEHHQGFMVIRMEPTSTTPSLNKWKVFLDETIESLGLFLSGFSSNSGDSFQFKAKRVLNFTGDQITGINILDGTVYWTDGDSEPKKVITENFIKDIFDAGGINITTDGIHGTANSGSIHSFFNVFEKDNNLIETNFNAIDFRTQPAPLVEEHLTVIKKSPLHPPNLIMSNTSDGRFTGSSAISTLTSSILDCFIDFTQNNLAVGTLKDIEFISAVDYVVGDLVLLRKDDSFEEDTLDEFEIIVEIVSISALNAKIKIVYMQNNLVNELADLTAPVTFYTMLQQEKPLYEFKLPRFAYRYKYQDNQYSTYSPFSEPAFLPGSFSYNHKEGHNLGMVNTLRSVYITDFVTDEDSIPKDVIEIDILYKESNSTNIYTVTTIKHSDDEWRLVGSPVNTYSAMHYARTTGRVQITSEMVRAAVASNQLLRPWDNVPRKAKAQEIVGNRIVYANYLQNYNL